MYARDSKCMCVFRGIVSYKMMQKGVPKITSILLSKQELYHCSRISQEYEPKLSFASPVAAYSIRYWSCSVRLNTFDNKLFTICQVDFYHVRTHAVSNISLCCATHLTIVNKAQKTFLLVEKSPMYQRIFQDSNIILYMWISVRYYPMPKPFHATHTHTYAHFGHIYRQFADRHVRTRTKKYCFRLFRLVWITFLCTYGPLRLNVCLCPCVIHYDVACNSFELFKCKSCLLLWLLLLLLFNAKLLMSYTNNASTSTYYDDKWWCDSIKD